MKEALFLRKTREPCGANVTCVPINCVIARGKRGICGVRENRGWYSCAPWLYGRFNCREYRSYEKSRSSIFCPAQNLFQLLPQGAISGAFTARIMIFSQMPVTGTLLWQNLSPNEIVSLAKQNGCESISYTYTEPTIFYEYAYDIAKLASAERAEKCFRNQWLHNRGAAPQNKPIS